MALIPVVCDSCETIWGAENIIVGAEVKDLNLKGGNMVSGCPECGGWGRIPDGVYDIKDDALKVVSSGSVPHDVLQDLIGKLESLRNGEATAEDVIDRAEAEAPELAPVIRNVLAKTDSKFWVSILIAILLWYLPSPEASSGPTAEEIATELRADNVPGLAVPERHHSKAKHKRPPKTRGKAKQRKSRKRR